MHLMDQQLTTHPQVGLIFININLINIQQGVHVGQILASVKPLIPLCGYQHFMAL